MKLCPKCHRKNPDQAKFCQYCGTKLPVQQASSKNIGKNATMFCPKCGHKVLKTTKFCPYCGHNLQKPTTDSANNTKTTTFSTSAEIHYNPESAPKNSVNNAQENYEDDTQKSVGGTPYTTDNDHVSDTYDFTPEERNYIEVYVRNHEKHILPAYLLLLVFICATHFYLHQNAAGIVILLIQLTDFIGVGLIIDFFWVIVDLICIPMWCHNIKARAKRQAISYVLMERQRD